MFLVYACGDFTLVSQRTKFMISESNESQYRFLDFIIDFFKAYINVVDSISSANRNCVQLEAQLFADVYYALPHHIQI